KSKFCDDALFMIGMSRFYRTEYVQSRASFEDLMERFPKSEYVERSLYWAGLAALKQGDTPGATKMFGRLAKASPDSRLNVEAVFRAAEGQLDATRDYEQARADLRAFIAAHPKSEFADGAALRIARTYYEEKRYDEASQEYARVLQRNPKPDVRYEAELRSALAIRAKAEEVLSNPALQRVLRERTAAAARTLLNSGVTPKKQKSKFAGPSAAQMAADSLAIVEADSTAAQMTGEEEAQMKAADEQVDQVLKRLLSRPKAPPKLGAQTEDDMR